MEDYDEFGDLYTDVLRPASTTSKPPPRSPPRSEDNDDDGRDRVLLGFRSGSPPSPLPSQVPALSVVPDAREGGDEDWIHGQTPVPEEQLLGWSDGEDEGFPRVSSGQATGLLSQRGGVFGVLLVEEEEVAAGLGEAPHKGVGENQEGDGVGEDVGTSVQGREAVVTPDVDDGTADLDQEPVIPGLSVASVLPGALDGTESGDTKVSRSGGWDSDSEDDLQIVLNDDNLGLAGGNRNVAAGVEEDGDDDGEDDLVIVTDEDQRHHHQGMEEQDWVDESMQQPLDGERKEKSDVTRANSETGTVALAKLGCSSQGYHGQYHSQFRYIRSGAAVIPGGAAAGTGAASAQVRPPLTTGPMAGRGRGAQKSFHSGYGLVLWSSGTSARAYGGGLEFTLPSHKTIFEIDIDGFEEKPWRLPGVDISDFFNFGFNEDKWRVLCKQLEQLRLEATMKSKIRVYESGRSERDYDPDLPPELAAAAGLHDISAESTQHGKADGVQADLIGQGRGALCLRPQLPIGRAIQVESSFGERLPSIDTRPPRIRDSDAIIEIVLQNSFDVCSGTLGQQLHEPQGQDVEGDHEDEDDDKHADSEHFNHFPPACSGGKRVVMKRKGSPVGCVDDNVPEGNGILPFPPDASSKYLPNSKSETPVTAGDRYVSSLATRPTQSNANAECSNDTISGQSVKLQTYDSQNERSGDRMEDEGILQISPVAPVETAVEVELEPSDEHNGRHALDDGAEIEKEETASDLRLSGECHGDNGPYHAVKKQKLSSRVEQLAVQDKDDGDDSRATHSDNSRAKSGSSKGYLKKHEGDEEEVMQGRRTRQIGDLTGHHHEEEQSFKQRDDYERDGRHGTNKSCATSKGREDMYQSRLYREHDSTNYGRMSEAFESGEARDNSFTGCLRREDDARGRRGKDEGRERDHDDEIGSRHRSKIRVSERKGKKEDLHSRKHIGDGDWKGRRDRDGAPRQRERDDISMSRHENFDDLHVRRRKDEEQPRREKVAKEDALHIRKGMEGTTQSKREKGNGANNKSRDDQTSVRDKVENHFTKHRDDNLRHREREDRQLNKFNEDMHTHKKREEGHTIVKGGRVLDDKRMGGIERVNSVSKGLGSDDYPSKDRTRHSEHRKRGDHLEEHTRAQHKGRQKIRPHENQSTNGESKSKNERFSSHRSHHLAALDSQQVCRERHRENSRKNKDSKGGETNCLAARKRKYEDEKRHLNEKVSAKGTNEQEGSNMSSSLLTKKGYHLTDKPSDVHEQHHFLGNDAEEDVASDDDSNQNVRRGRSKLERWTSHKERDFGSSSPQPLSSSSRARESGVSNVDIIQLGDSIKTKDSKDDSDAKDAEVMQIDHTGEEGDCHLDAVAKLKKQSERFKHPMPGEEDTTMTENPENEVPLIQSGTVMNAEIKQERPARKRRWTAVKEDCLDSQTGGDGL